jgi:hypothetical protein
LLGTLHRHRQALEHLVRIALGRHARDDAHAAEYIAWRNGFEGKPFKGLV